jgi:hypothetical protein
LKGRESASLANFLDITQFEVEFSFDQSTGEICFLSEVVQLAVADFEQLHHLLFVQIV